MELPKVLGNFWEEPGQAGNFPEVSKSGRQGATRVASGPARRRPAFRRLPGPATGS